MMLLALRREGIAGVCGVCGEIGFPGEEAVEKEVPAIMAGTLDSCRLDEDDERWSIVDAETDSASPVWESLMRWYLFSWAAVLCVLVVLAEMSAWVKLLRSFFVSRSFKKSEMFSSSVGASPELPPVPSLKVPDPRCIDDDTLPFPLLRSSFSVLLPPPDENLLLLWPKLLL
jgi:hypothetical protein